MPSELYYSSGSNKRRTYLRPIDTSKLENFDELFAKFKEQKECFDGDTMYAVPLYGVQQL